MVVAEVKNVSQSSAMCCLHSLHMVNLQKHVYFHMEESELPHDVIGAINYTNIILGMSHRYIKIDIISTV